jgi:hypothetical protein
MLIRAVRPRAEVSQYRNDNGDEFRKKHSGLNREMMANVMRFELPGDRFGGKQIVT